jgi:phosphoglycolate phosphatase-like HAD superfamily hydrolase
VSRKQEFQAGAQPPKRTAVIFDMDGTLVDVSGIRHHVTGPKKNFDAFHSESIDSPPHPDVVQAVHDAKAAGHDAMIVTARDAKWRNITAAWLGINKVPSDGMFMRAHGDQRPDYEVKKEIHAKLSQTHDIVHAYDDNPSVIKLWHEKGIPTTVVPGWDDQPKKK